MDMDQRVSTDGCLNYEGVPTDGFSQRDIGIIFQNVWYYVSLHDGYFYYP